jgi:Glycosyl transferase family 2
MNTADPRSETSGSSGTGAEQDTSTGDDRMSLADLIRGSAPIGIAWAAALAFGWLLVVALARVLGPERLGSAAAAIGMIVIVVAVALGWLIRGMTPARIAAGDQPRRLASSVLAVACTTLLLESDLLIAWARLPAHEAGVYAGPAAFTRLLVLVPALWATVVLRRPAASDTNPFRWFQRSLAVTSFVLALGCLGLSILRTPLTRAILGGAFASSADLVPPLAVQAACLALVWELSFVHFVVRSREHALILCVVVIEAVWAATGPVSPDWIAGVALVGAATALLLSYVGGRAVTRWSPPLSRLRPHREVGLGPTPSDDDVELSLVLPCYNPGPGFDGFLADLVAELQQEGHFELIVVSDGGTGEVIDIARQLDTPAVRVLHYTERSGKGHALRVGLREAGGRFVGFIDADGDIDPTAVKPFLSLMRLYQPDVVLGSKRHPMSNVNYPTARRIMSWTYHKLTRLLFRVEVSDTQTGLKLVRRDVLAEVLPRMFEKRYAFDLELLVVARLLGFTKVFEAPVTIDYKFSSNVDPNAVVRILMDTAAIFYRRYILDTYRHVDDRLLLVRSDEPQPSSG